MSEKKKVLWILHHPWETIAGQREYFLINNLKEKLDIHVVTWSHNRGRSRLHFLNPFYYGKTLQFQQWQEDGLHFYHLPVLPNFSNFFAKSKMHSFAPNRWLYRFFLDRIHRQERFDAVVYGTNHWHFGHPPRFPGAKMIFDYLDSYPDDLLKEISAYSDACFCVSHTLKHQGERFFDKIFYSPNGIQTERFQHPPSKDEAKSQLHLQDKVVVSLIGLTCSPEFYFVDALSDLHKKIPHLVFLFVGGGAVGEKLEKHCQALNLPFVHPGRIPYQEIQKYFSATDVGLYPGELSHVYDGACPLKVLEYTASQRPVVSSPTKELKTLNLSSVTLAHPERESFAQAIENALNSAPSYPDMNDFDWQKISIRFYDDLIRLTEPGVP